MMRSIINISFIICSLSLLLSCNSQPTDSTDKIIGLQDAEDAGFELTVQTYPYRNIYLFGAIDSISNLGVKNIEIYYEHPLGTDFQNQTFNIKLTDEECDRIKKYAEEHDINIAGCGVFTAKDDEEWEDLFLFAEKMGFSYIVCNPQPEQIKLIKHLAHKYKIKVAIHNEAEKKNFWNADLLIESMESEPTNGVIGSCADIANWKRNGLDPIKELEKLKGRLISIHLNDLTMMNLDDDVLRDEIITRGIVDVEYALQILREQGFKGNIVLEYNVEPYKYTNRDIELSIYHYGIANKRLYDLYNETNKN